MSEWHLPLWPALAASLTLGCSGSDSKSSDAPKEAPEPSLETASTPTDVSGAFLVGCSASTSVTFVKDDEKSSDLAACLVRDKDGKPVEGISDIIVKTTVAAQESTPSIIDKETDAPWSVGFSLPSSSVATVQTVAVSFKIGTDKMATVKTDNVVYDWTKDPHFADFLTFTKTLLEAANPGVTFDSQPSQTPNLGNIAEHKAAKRRVHIAFTTDNVFRGNVSESVADQACVDAGAKVDPELTWVALLSTKARHAKDKILIEDIIFGFGGEFVAEASKFWLGEWVSPIRYTETGKNAATGIVYTDASIPFSFNAWTGTGAGGVYDETAGNCDDWSSASPSTTGRTAFVANLSKGAASKVFYTPQRCDVPARLICISQAMTYE